MLMSIRRLITIIFAVSIGILLLNTSIQFFHAMSNPHLQNTYKRYMSNKRSEPVYKKTNVRLHAATTFFRSSVDDGFLRECSVKDHCKFVDDRSSADAIIYHAPDMHTMGELTSNQIAVIWSLESPINHHFHQNLRGRINWTMTYRKDADVWFPYGVITKRERPAQIDYDKIWKMKTKMAIWLISNCRRANGRIELTEALQKAGLQVDIYGTCGNTSTPNNCDGVNKQSDDCVIELFKPYLFAISFENSLCKDYVTEKFFEVLQKRYAIPIVMQRKIYKEIDAPADSFIAVDDYKNVNELVSDLRRIANDKSAYLRYHQWREAYDVRSDYFTIDDTGFCELCKKIMRQDFTPKHYDNVAKWHSHGICEQPQDGFVSRFLKNYKMIS